MKNPLALAASLTLSVIGALSLVPAPSVYGVSGLFVDMDDVRAHGRDERIGIESFFEGQEFLYRLVKALSSGAVS